MADILLTHCNHLFADRKQVRKMQPYPPLQTILAAARLRRQGWDVALFDATFEQPREGFRQAISEHRPKLVALLEDNFNFLTKMCLGANRELALWMCRQTSAAGVPMLVNGSDSGDNAAAYLDAGASAVILGEVESTLAETAAALLGDTPNQLYAIPGLALPAPGNQHVTAARQRLENLDTLPLPAWDLVDINAYRQAWRNAHGYFSLNMISSRGCPYRCNWCAKPLYGSAYTHRSPESVAAELALLKRQYAPDQIWFADDIFALSNRWTRAFADAVESLDARIPFKMQSRCDLMTRDTVSALRRAGCAEVWMGAESGSQKILDAMDKDTRVEQIKAARGNLKSHGIRACFFLQFGYPGETWDDIRGTIGMVRDAAPDDIGVSVSYPLAGTVFHNRVAAQLGDQRHWRDSDDLAMMFHGAYTSDFYRALRDALHLEVDTRQGRVPSADGNPKLAEAWRQVEQLEKSCAHPDPTPIWTSC